MDEKKYDPKHLHKLNNPERLKNVPPGFVWEKLNMKTADVIIEIGAGTGIYSIEFLRLANAQKLYACDISDTMLNWMTENVVPKHPRIIPFKTEESRIPLDDGIADLVFMINLHHELDNPPQMLKEANRLLKPGGKIFIADWRRQDMPDGPPTHIRYTATQVKEELEAAGFNSIMVDETLPKHFLIIARK